MNEFASNSESNLDDDPLGVNSDDRFAPGELPPSPHLLAHVKEDPSRTLPPIRPSTRADNDLPDDAFWSEWCGSDGDQMPASSIDSATNCSRASITPTTFVARVEARRAEAIAVEPEPDFFDDVFADDGTDTGSVNERRTCQVPRIVSDPVASAAKRLKAALGTARGKIRIPDAHALAGFPHPDYYWRGVVGRAMQRIGWHRRRCRLGGKLGYAYAKGTPHERKMTLEIERCDDGHVVIVKRS